MHHLKMLAAAALAVTLSAPASATVVAISGQGQWFEFGVDSFASQSFGVEWIDNANTLSPGYGSPLNFTFTIGSGLVGTLTVVDAGFAGDTFQITSFGNSLGNTSSVPLTTFDPDALNELDFSGALANPAFSRGVFQLGAGNYSISGTLLQSVMLGENEPLKATFGAVSLTVSAVPEPSAYALLLAGLGLMGTMARRKRS